MAEQYLENVRSVVKHIFIRPVGESFQSVSQGAGSGILPIITTNAENIRFPNYLDEGTITAVAVIFIIWQVVFSIGAALQSYIYNKTIGTSNILTFIYMILCFFFSALYYPYYTFFLGGGAGSRAANSSANYPQVAGRRK